MARPDSDDPANFSQREIAPIMIGLMLAMMLASLDQTIVATALTAMARDLNGWALMPWVVSGYLVTSTVTTPIYGRLSDLYGRRPVLLIAIGLFAGGAVLCALSQTMVQLVGARLVQGVGGGGLRAVSQAAIADIVPPRERGRIQGYFSAVFTVSNALGPVVGGLIADYLSWHWIFWLYLPLAAAALFLSNRALKRLPKPTRKPVIDWAGAVLILASATPILLGVGQAQKAGGWASFEVFGPIALGVIFIVALVLRERVASEPMLPLRLFANPTFSLCSLIAFLNHGVMIALIMLVPINYQLASGMSANQAGMRLISMTVGAVLGSFIAGQLVSRTGRYRIFPIIGTTTTAIMCAAIAWVGLGRSTPLDVAATLLLGLSFGFQLSPLTVVVQNALDIRDTGIGMSCLMFFRLMGGAFVVSLLSAVLIGSLDAGAAALPGLEVLGPHRGLALFQLDERSGVLTPVVMQALEQTIRHAFAVVFGVAAALSVCALVGACLLKEVPLRGREEPQREQQPAAADD
ncbi:MAG: MFS transporter [Proteobacteria bacterium]|nr:MFS transporter [Pseudomonadota bacterium]